MLRVFVLVAAVFICRPFAAVADEFTETIRPLLVTHCGKCHDPSDEDDPVGFLRAETADEVAENRGVWASAAEQLLNRTMPPSDEKQPSEGERFKSTQWIESHLQATACRQGPYAGSPPPRRLNREQYEYVIEDLTGAEFDFVETFPADGGGGEGFNNNGELLFLPPLLMERYLEVATRIADRVIAVPPMTKEFVADEDSGGRIRQLRAQRSADDSGSPVRVTKGNRVSVSVIVHQDADYVVTTRAEKREEADTKWILRLDGQRLATLPLKGARKSRLIKSQVRLTKGPHVFVWSGTDETAVDLTSVRIRQVESSALAQQKRWTQKLFAPGESELESAPREAARRILDEFTSRAWRRPLKDGELERLDELFHRGIDRGEPFEQAIKLPLKAALVSPHFLFITEEASESESPQPISDLELASRLSFFLWHSIPDRELLVVATEGRLREEAEFRRQIRRMLADPRSLRFSQAFAGQWLGTEAVGRTKIPDTNFFKPAYTSELVLDLRRQVTETMHWMLQNDRPITDWLDADYAVLNRRLAKHYDVGPLPGSNDRFVRVELSDSPRTSILGMGAVHMLTSYSRRTSPVLRGGWVLETVFGVHLPSPPPDAGDLPGGEKEDKKRTVRDRLVKHRENPTCAACHDLIDPIGFALENFDVLGRWREKEGERPIDAVGKLPSGESFDGPTELRRVLVARLDDFREQLCRKMLGFALGRSLVDADACTIQQLAETLRANDDRLVVLVEAIATSFPFTHRGNAL